MKRTTELKRTSTLKRTLIHQVSTKQQNRIVKYNALRGTYMDEHPVCEVTGCELPSTDCHHKAGRIGNNMFRHFMAVCRVHHVLIHAKPITSRVKGYLFQDDPRRE